ncbi:MAG: response regulator, partial [Bdellovibrionia bacterium]
MADIVKTKASILIVEDEPIVAMDVESLLLRLAYNVVAIANNGKEAIEKAETLRPDLILMDIHIQGEIDGIQAADEIQRQFQIPIIFLTAYADEATLQRAKGSAPFGYILKPFEETELGTTIEIALHKHRNIQARDKASKEMLERSEKHFRLFVESVKDYAIFMLDLNGVIVSWNPGAERITGYLVNDVIGRHSSIFYTQEDILAKVPQKAFDIALKNGRYEEEGLRVRKDSSRFLANSVVTVLLDSAGKAVGFAKVLRDITEKNRNEQLIKEQTEELEQFEYRTSHDLRSPLLSLGSLLDFVKEDINEGHLDEAQSNIAMCNTL